MNMPAPFATENAPTEASANHPFAAGAANTAQAAAPAATADTGEKKTRKPSRRLSMEEQQYVLTNYVQKNPSTIAQELNLQASQSGRTGKGGAPLAEVTSQQVANTVRSTRKKVEDRIKAAVEAGDQATADALTAKLEETLPKRSFRGTGSGNTGPRTSSLDSLVDNLFSV